MLRMNNLQDSGWILDDVKLIDLSPKEVALWRLEKGDLVFNRTNSKELVGKCEVFDLEGDWVFASYLLRLRVDERQVLPTFLRDFLSCPAGRSQIDRDSRQIAGMSNINAEEVRNLLFPKPDLATQGRLVREMTAARGEWRRKLQEATVVLRGLDGFVLSQLGLDFPEPDARRVWATRLGEARDRFDPDYHSPRFHALRDQTEHGKYSPRTIGSLCSVIQTGFAAGGDAQTDDVAIGIPHIRPLNISSTAELRFEGTKMVPRSAVRSGDLLTRGEVLFNNTNSTAWVGKSVVFDAERECACSNHITRLVLADKRDSPHFFAALLNALRGMGYFGVLSTNFNNQAGVNVETLATVRLSWPDHATQDRIAGEIERRRVKATRLRDGASRGWMSAQKHFESELLDPPTKAAKGGTR